MVRLVSFMLVVFMIFSSASVFGAEEEAAIKIAFLDSGVSLKHINSDGVESGENFVFPSHDTDDRIGHGTATAGIVKGSDELGISGVCPTAKIIPLVCFDTYPTGIIAPTDTENMALAVRAAVDKYDCRIINISMGTTSDDPKLKSAIEYALKKGAIVVSAVGNEQENNPDRVYYPAAYDGVIGVGAANRDKCASFSQHSFVDVLAKGVNIETVTNRNAAKSEYKSGTSYACAYISGVCAKIWTENPNLTAEQVYALLIKLAYDVGDVGYDSESGWGIVDTEYDADQIYFKDTFGHYASESIAFCAENEIFKGDANGYFYPDDYISRTMFVTALYRFADEPYYTQGTSCFSDVAQNEWYSDAVGWACEAKITNGVQDGIFGINDCITREQAVVMLYRYLKAYNLDAPTAKNVLETAEYLERISDYATDAVYYAAENGIIKADYISKPMNLATRAEIAVMLHRLSVK